MEQLDKNWYVVNTYASHENKVKDNILRRIETMNMQDYIFRVIVAEYEEPVKKNGVPTGKTKMKNMYPGYIFIEMYMTMKHGMWLEIHLVLLDLLDLQEKGQNHSLFQKKK